jgi:hypothetical protein
MSDNRPDLSGLDPAERFQLIAYAIAESLAGSLEALDCEGAQIILCLDSPPDEREQHVATVVIGYARPGLAFASLMEHAASLAERAGITMMASQVSHPPKTGGQG